MPRIVLPVPRAKFQKTRTLSSSETIEFHFLIKAVLYIYNEASFPALLILLKEISEII